MKSLKISIKKRENLWVLCGLLLFGLIYFSSWIFTGLDLTDTGYHLFSQATLFEGTTSSLAGLSFGSNLIGRLWNQLLGQPLLIWSRVGYVFLLSMTLIFSYLALAHYFRPRTLILPYIVTIPFVSRGVELIHYHTFPAFITVLIFYLYTKLVQKQQQDKVRYYSLTIGLLIGMATLSRFPSILLLSLPFFAFLYSIIWSSPIKKLLFNHVKFVLLGFLIFMLILTILAVATPFLQTYTSAIREVFLDAFFQGNSAYKGRYTLSSQINNWIDVYRKIFPLMARIALFSLIVALLFQTKIGSHLTVRYFVYFLLTIFIFRSFVFRSTGGWLGYITGNIRLVLRQRTLIRYYLPAFILFTFLALVIFSKNSMEQMNKTRFAYLLAIIIMLITPLGSNTFAAKFRYAYWIVLPMGFALCIKMSRNKFREGSLHFTNTFSRLAIAGTISLFIVGSIFQFHGAYRDYSNRLQLDTELQHYSLNLIHTSKERAESVDNVLSVIESNSKPGERILCVGKIPLLSYLTGRKPYIYDPWPTYLPVERFSRLIHDNQEEFGFPKLIVRTKYSVSDRNWPNTERKYLENKPHFSVLQDLIKKHNYDLIWENKMFAVLSFSRVNGKRVTLVTGE